MTYEKLKKKIWDSNKDKYYTFGEPNNKHHIRLSDVLLALFMDETIMGNEWGVRVYCADQGDAYFQIYDYCDNDKIIKTGGRWDLKDDELDLQSEETKQFLANSLS